MREWADGNCPASDRRDPRGHQPGPAAHGPQLFSSDRVLVEALRREGAEWAEDRAREVGAFSGTAQANRWGLEANENPPRLRTHDRFGNRIDEVEFHPAWHELLGAGVGFGLHALPWREPQPGRPCRPRGDVHALARPRPASAVRSR